MPDKQMLEHIEEQAFPRKFWAERYHISERTLSRAIADGRLRCLRFGKAVRITPAQFAAFVEALED